MNTALDDNQVAIRDLAADLFSRRVDAARVEKIEATTDRFDRELWSALADSGLLGAVVAEEHGGLGFGAVELALVLEQLGRSVAPVPLVATALASWCLATHATVGQRTRWLPGLLDGSRVVAVAAPASTVGVRADGDRLTGTVVGVAWAHVADAVLLPVGADVFLLDLASIAPAAARGETTAREVALDLDLDGVPAERVGESAAGWLRLRARAALAAVQAGVTDAALRMTADYTSQREQFDKPLSTFQGVALKAADAYLDTTAIRATSMQAAWSLDQTDDATLAVLTAAWWAAEAGQHCVHLTQHLHGGMGADITYPVHRYFLWGKQIELLLGGASSLLEELGGALNARPDAGHALVLD
ncbi:MAG: 3-oxocholest-4-en-26-oyl-CoA dehydrogenase beta subunit [Frankiaceae bacterium]|jgi:acyl-CoA dehydrogenase|nr:3-oxocholest-4-en-26-oyl-CoA dehydrogenase beta subunit [Frankiaceae bacterium]